MRYETEYTKHLDNNFIYTTFPFYPTMEHDHNDKLYSDDNMSAFDKNFERNYDEALSNLNPWFQDWQEPDVLDSKFSQIKNINDYVSTSFLDCENLENESIYPQNGSTVLETVRNERFETTEKPLHLDCEEEEKSITKVQKVIKNVKMSKEKKEKLTKSYMNSEKFDIYTHISDKMQHYFHSHHESLKKTQGRPRKVKSEKEKKKAIDNWSAELCNEVNKENRSDATFTAVIRQLRSVPLVLLKLR